jgi:hypothetical protein
MLLSNPNLVLAAEVSQSGVASVREEGQGLKRVKRFSDRL